MIDEAQRTPSRPGAAGEPRPRVAGPAAGATEGTHLGAPTSVVGGPGDSPSLPSHAPSQTWRLTVVVEQIGWVAVVILAALVRLPALGALPLGLTDSTRAFAAWQVAAGRLPAAWNGDVAETLAALLFKLFGSGDGLARLAPAMLGVLLVAAIWFFRPFAGRAASLLAALAVSLSPVCVAVSRSISPYAAGALFSLAAAAALLTFVQAPRPAPLAWLAGLAGLGLATDASFLVFVLAVSMFCIVEAIWKRSREFDASVTYLGSHRSLLSSSALIGLAGLLIATTRFGIAPERLRSAAAASWSQAFSRSPAGVPWHLSLDTLVAYEPFLFLGGLAVIVLILKRAGIKHTEERAERGSVGLCERLLIYWVAAGLVFVLVISRRETGQLPILLVPVALAIGIQSVQWLETARWSLLRPAIAPTLLAFPAFVYVLFKLESATVSADLSVGQQSALAFLVLAGLGLIVLGAVWSRGAAPAFVTICCLTIATVFALHSLTRVGFHGGDEFLLGPVATVEAPALSEEIARAAPTLKGSVSIDPSLTAPLAWYTRGNAAVRIQAISRASGGIVQPADQAAPASFEPLVAASEIARAWYPAGVDLGGILRWLLYRQAWEPVRGTPVQFLVKSEQP